ncbi:MAG TPA: methionine--tRNA ligase subunit beta [Candidatus Paceibacterota bacterium]|nr:methionine--tRNA ligase subunit beta [Candidatus Paceibacterota bacterium]
MTLDEFKQCDLRVAKVVAADRVDGSEKLLRLRLDLGADGERQVLSGIARSYAPDEIAGKLVVIIANLEPRTMMGLESQGMLLAAAGADGRPVILAPAGDDVPPGTRIT